MAKLIAASQSSMLLLPQLQPHASFTVRGVSYVRCGRITVSSSFEPAPSSAKSKQNWVLTISAMSTQSPLLLKGCNPAPIPRASNLDVKLPGEADDIQPDTTGGAGDEGSGKDQSGGGQGGGGDENGSNKDKEGSDEGDPKKHKGLLMSQKITLAYAALVGLGGFMGYLKSGSVKSLTAGGFSSLLLYYVFTELPKRPVYASAVGLGLSAALLMVMGSRFKRSGKVFPAGIVSLASLIMSGGYVHGMMKVHRVIL